ncbi:hypothetical protein R4670_16000 [Acinetobacter baumannii]|nr:hypothetical protein [Acinetobacter baumannii]
MKSLFRRGLTTLLCVGTLVAGTQSWAADAKQANSASTEVKVNPKAQENCKKPCDMKSEEKNQQDHSQHDHSKMTDMSQMDHSKMMNMDHSNMSDMDHSKMMNMDHSKMNMSNK